MAVATLNDTLLSMELSAIHTPTTQFAGQWQNCNLQRVVNVIRLHPIQDRQNGGEREPPLISAWESPA
jgi:hypothetical protein